MSRDNSISIKAGGNVSLEATAVGDGAQAASIRSSGEAKEIAERFLQVRTVIDELESKGELPAVEARLLRAEAEDVEKTAQAALTDEAEKDTLGAKLKRFALSLHGMCKASEKTGVFAALSTIAAVCGIPSALTGLPFVKLIT